MRIRSLLACLVFLATARSVAQTQWAVDPKPILDVPGLGADGVVRFGYPAGAMRRADGSLLIADRSENGIRVIGPSGKLIHTVGRAGEGPGEFQSMLWAGRCGGDSLLVWDLRLNRASMVGPDGVVARQFAVPAGDTARPPMSFTCGATQGMGYLSLPSPAPAAGERRDPTIVAVLASLYRVSPTGVVTQRLGEIPAGEVMLVTSPTGGRGSLPRPLAGSAYAAIAGGAVVIGAADSATATVVREDGRTSRIRFPALHRAPTREEFDAAIQVTASIVPPQMQQAAVKQLSAGVLPDHLPPLFGLFGDPDGLLWVQRSPPGAKGLDLMAMGLDGRVIAQVQLAAPLNIFEIGRDYLLGSYTSADDEIHVAVYRLHRR